MHVDSVFSQFVYGMLYTQVCNHYRILKKKMSRTEHSCLSVIVFSKFFPPFCIDIVRIMHAHMQIFTAWQVGVTEQLL